MIYLDNNATTMMTVSSQKVLVEWLNKGNPSASYNSALKSQELIDQFRKYLATQCDITNAPPDKPNPTNSTYTIIFTSGSAESNATIIRSITDAFAHQTGTKPHIVSSTIEHSSILDLLRTLSEQGIVEVSLVQPNTLGFIDPATIKSAIKTNTCLVSIQTANNETGAMMDMEAIGKICLDAKVPLHTDATQHFGKYPIKPDIMNITAFSVSFHKIYGPVGIGALVIKTQLIQGYKLRAIIAGSQNYCMRGGTIPIPLIAAAFDACKTNYTERQAKNKRLLDMKRLIISKISEKIPCKTYAEYLASLTNKQKNEIEIVFISTAEKRYLPNTLMLSVVKRSEPVACNVALKDALYKAGIIVSVGSACNTSSPFASHVITSMGADNLIKKGVLRISLGDNNTSEECEEFVAKFLAILKSEFKI